jgi:hypothetical protein
MIPRTLWGVVLISAVTTPAYAQGLEFSLGGGVSIPVGEFGSTTNTGWHGLAGISYARGPVGVRVDGALNRFDFDTEGGPDLDIQTQVLHGTANAVYSFNRSGESRLRPYLIGGVGYYQTKQTGDDADAGDTADPGVNGGAGIGLRAGAVGGFVEGRFHNIFMTGTDTNSAFVAFTIGVTLGGT